MAFERRLSTCLISLVVTVNSSLIPCRFLVHPSVPFDIFSSSSHRVQLQFSYRKVVREVLKEEVIQEKASPPKLNKSPRERRKSEGQDFKIRDKVEPSVDLFEVNDTSSHNKNIWEEPVKKVKGGRPRKSSTDEAEEKVKTVKARKAGRGRKPAKKPVMQKQATMEEFSDEEMEETSKPQVKTI